MKIIITESQYYKAVDKFITYQLESHEEKTSKKYPDSIFWVKHGEVIAEIDKKHNNFWVDYEIWDTISLMFSFEDKETQEVIGHWLEEHYGLGGLTPLSDNTLSNYTLEKH